MAEPTDLQGPALLAFRSLRDDPSLNTAEGISDGPYGVEELGPSEMLDGLIELGERGLAVQRPDQTWRLTDAVQTT
jgi:hypothetical protein